MFGSPPSYLMFDVSIEDVYQMLKRFFHSSYIMCLIWRKPRAAPAGFVEKGFFFFFFSSLKDDFKLRLVFVGNQGIETSAFPACAK